jgi:hypothetical protein
MFIDSERNFFHLSKYSKIMTLRNLMKLRFSDSDCLTFNMIEIKENLPVNYIKFYPEDGAIMFLRNVDTHLQGTVS